MSDIKQFKLPDVGEGLTEADVVTWKVKVGDVIKVNDIVVEIETAKSLVELPSPYAGTVTELLVDEGQTVDVGTPIIRVDVDAASSTSTSAAAAPQPPPGPVEVHEPVQAPAAGEVGSVAEDLVPSPKPDEPVEPGLIGGPAPGGRTSVLVGYGPRTTEAKRRPRRGATALDVSPAAAQVGVQRAFTPYATPAPQVDIADAAPAAPSTAASPLPTEDRTDLRALAKPPVRKLAKDLGVELGDVTPTGHGGMITRDDVERHASGVAAPPPSSTASSEPGSPAAWSAAPENAAARELRVPVRGVRKVTAQAMVTSAFTAPHVTEWITIDATRTVKLVDRLRTHRDFRDVKVSPLLVVSRAVCLAVRRTPELNASWDEATQEIVLKRYVNLGIAAATPRGLVVPNIKDAEQLSARELAAALQELTTVARDGRTQPAQMAGGTFTITNVGVFGVDAGTPILNPGESGILAMGVIRRQPWMVGNKIKPRWVTTLALSFDHRVADGEQGSRFLADVASIVQDPGNSILL
jgi:2-oxoisovalerate dehydrogenase E2 component (dihydrolipoyl transacylase)